MALQKEIWINDIQDVLYQGAEFVTFGTDHSAWVSNKVVHVPQSGAIPAVVQNRTTLPATIAQRTDTELTYNLNSYTTDPTLVQDIDELQTSYAKRSSVMGQQISKLNQSIGDHTGFAWAEGTSSFRTSGASGTANGPIGSTGSRKIITKEDITKMARKLDVDNVASGNRYLVLPSELYYELFNTDELINRNYMNNVSLPSGVLNEILGFKVLSRPTVVVGNAAGVKQAVGAAVGATDNHTAIAFQSEYVAKALGTIKVFADMDKPEFYGSVLSAEVMHGATALRTSAQGIVSLSQEA